MTPSLSSLFKLFLTAFANSFPLLLFLLTRVNSLVGFFFFFLLFSPFLGFCSFDPYIINPSPPPPPSLLFFSFSLISLVFPVSVSQILLFFLFSLLFYLYLGFWGFLLLFYIFSSIGSLVGVPFCVVRFRLCSWPVDVCGR